MRDYWLLNHHGSDGPTALVEIDGRMKIVDIVKFGPDVSELEAQQKVWDDVIGRVGPTLKSFVPASKVKEAGIAPHADLRRSSHRGVGPVRRSGRNDGRSPSGEAEFSGTDGSDKRGTGAR